jgi:hypothetical protein
VSRKPYEKPRVVNSLKLPPWVSKARLAWMVMKGMKVEDAVKMIGAKAVDLARDHDTAKSSDVK